MWKTGDSDTSKIATPKRVLAYRPKHRDTSLSREWRINMANKKKKNSDLHSKHNQKQSKEERYSVPSKS